LVEAITDNPQHEIAKLKILVSSVKETTSYTP